MTDYICVPASNRHLVYSRGEWSLSILSGADLRGARLTGADLFGADLFGATLTGANLTDAILTGANLTGATLTDATLTCADLTDAILTCADLRGSVLSYADLTHAILSGADLSDTDLSGADLQGADLRGARLTCADLFGADLFGAGLTDAILTGANLTGANLTDAILTCADLTDADLRYAFLRRADLTGADLTGADLRCANTRNTRGLGADLQEKETWTQWMARLERARDTAHRLAVARGYTIRPREHARILPLETTAMTEEPVCPRCGVISGDELSEFGDVLEDGSTCEVECDVCEELFSVTVHVAYSTQSTLDAVREKLKAARLRERWLRGLLYGMPMFDDGVLIDANDKTCRLESEVARLEAER